MERVIDRPARRQRRIRRADLRRYVRSAPKRRNVGRIQMVTYATGVGTVEAGPNFDQSTANLLSDIFANEPHYGPPKEDAQRECPVCGVRGIWAKCVTRSGNNAAKPHKGRFDE